MLVGQRDDETVEAVGFQLLAKSSEAVCVAGHGTVPKPLAKPQQVLANAPWRREIATIVTPEPRNVWASVLLKAMKRAGVRE
jgi:hypothetical protein